ncbi:MAG: hypothetical protein ACYTG7_05250 [Planctomycetota bacterium]|jgi:hypothetical protein
MLLFFVGVGACMGAYFLHGDGASQSYPLDDAWIHMVYARNMTEGALFSYNPPEPEAGFTSPLWLLLMTGIHFFTESVLAPKILGLIFLVLLAFMAGRYGGWFAGLLILLDSMICFAALSGMEITLFTFLCILALERFHQGRYGQAGWAVAGALLARPEGLVLLGVLVLFSLPIKENKCDKLKQAALILYPSLLAAGLWIAFCLSVAGRPFPNTFYAKIYWLNLFDTGSVFELVKRLLFDFDGIMDQGGDLFPWIVLLPLILLILLDPGQPVWILFLLTLGLFLGTWITRPVLRIEAFYWARYFIPALACFYLLAGMGIRFLSKSDHFMLSISGWAIGLLMAGGLLWNADRISELYERNCRDIARYNVAAGQWLARNTSSEDRIAVLDAGAIKYFSERTIIDLGGLNDRRLTDLTGLEGSLDSGDPAALAAHFKADWLALFRRHFSGNRNFTVYEQISYRDYSLYIIPEPFTLLILKKEPINN